MLSVSLVPRVRPILLEVCTIICLGVNRHLVSGHEISRLQHGLQLIMARYTRIINCRPCCNLYIRSQVSKMTPRGVEAMDAAIHCVLPHVRRFS